jgi:hypothetical protein
MYRRFSPSGRVRVGVGWLLGCRLGAVRVVRVRAAGHVVDEHYNDVYDGEQERADVQEMLRVTVSVVVAVSSVTVTVTSAGNGPNPVASVAGVLSCPFALRPQH